MRRCGANRGRAQPVARSFCVLSLVFVFVFNVCLSFLPSCLVFLLLFLRPLCVCFVFLFLFVFFAPDKLGYVTYCIFLTFQQACVIPSRALGCILCIVILSRNCYCPFREDLRTVAYLNGNWGSSPFHLGPPVLTTDNFAHVGNIIFLGAFQPA